MTSRRIVIDNSAPLWGKQLETDLNGVLSSLGAGGGSGSFVQSGTGAQSRTLTSKLQDTVNVLDFYAPADGADYGLAFNRAIAALQVSASKYGGKIRVPRGSYDILTPVVIASGQAFFDESRIVFEGDGWGTLINAPVGFPTGGAMFTTNGGMTVWRDLCFANNSGDTSINCILAQGASQIVDAQAPKSAVLRCRLTSFNTAIKTNNASDFRVEGCSFLSNTRNIYSPNGSMGFWIIGNVFQGGIGITFSTAGAGGVTGWASEGRYIIGNGMVSMVQGIVIEDGLAYEIVGNNIDANTLACITLDGTSFPIDSVNIVGNWLGGSGTQGIYAAGTVRNSSISNNDMIGAGANSRIGIWLNGSGVHNLTISSNRMSGNQNRDLKVDGSLNIIVTGNQMDSATSVDETSNASCYFDGNTFGGTLNKSSRSTYGLNYGDGLVSTGANQLIGTTGFTVLPGGIIKQWGVATPAGADPTVVFPKTFPTACYGVQCTPVGANGATQLLSTNVDTVTTASFVARPRFVDTSGTPTVGRAAQSFFWEAIGR